MKFLAVVFVCASSAYATEYACHGANCIFEEQGCTMEDARRSQLDSHANLTVEKGQSATLVYGDFPNRFVHEKLFNFSEQRNGRDLYHHDITRNWWAWFDISSERPFNFKGDWSEERDIFLAVNLKLEDPLTEYFVCEAK